MSNDSANKSQNIQRHHRQSSELMNSFFCDDSPPTTSQKSRFELIVNDTCRFFFQMFFIHPTTFDCEYLMGIKIWKIEGKLWRVNGRNENCRRNIEYRWITKFTRSSLKSTPVVSFSDKIIFHDSHRCQKSRENQKFHCCFAFKFPWKVVKSDRGNDTTWRRKISVIFIHGSTLHHNCIISHEIQYVLNLLNGWKFFITFRFNKFPFMKFFSQLQNNSQKSWNSWKFTLIFSWHQKLNCCWCYYHAIKFDAESKEDSSTILQMFCFTSGLICLLSGCVRKEKAGNVHEAKKGKLIKKS